MPPTFTQRRAWATLTGPYGAIDHGGTLKVSWGADKGWTWSCQPKSLPAIRHARDAVYSITMHDGYGNSLTTPDLVALQRTKRWSRNVSSPSVRSLGGVDLTTFKQGKRNQSFPSFRATTSEFLLETLATRAGIEISGIPDWYIGEEEVKGETLASAIQRLQKAVAYDAVTGTDGAITLTAWEDVGDGLDFPIANVEERYDPSQVFTGVRLGKRTSRPNNATQRYEYDHADSYEQELSSPLLSPAANTGNDMGAAAIMAVAFFDGDPNVEETGLVAFQSFTGPWGTPSIPSYSTSETGIATHIVVETYNIGSAYPLKALLVVTGTPYDEEDPPPDGVDLAFLYPVPNGDPEDPETYDTSLGDWPSNQDAIDPLFQGTAQAIDRYPSYLDKLNALGGGDTLAIDGTFHLGPRPLQRYTHQIDNLAGDDLIDAAYKVWDISWDLGAIQTQINLVRVTV